MAAGIDWLVSRPIAHRGLHDRSAGIPENSIPAFERAAQGGYPIELDVHPLADGATAVFHDPTLDRMTDATGAITALGVSQLRRLRLDGTDHHVPTLDEVFECVNGRVPLLIEIKTQSSREEVCRRVDSLLRGYAGQAAVQSFDPFVLGWFVRHAPRIPRGQLAGSFRGERLPRYKKTLLSNLLMRPVSRPHFIAYEHRSLPAVPVLVAQALGLPIIAWTVRSSAEYVRALRWCDNVIFEGFTPIGAPGRG